MEFDEFVGGAIGLLLIVIFIGMAVFLVVCAFGVPWRMECNTYTELYGDTLEFNYTYWTGCLVKAPNGKWVDVNEFMQYYGDLHTLQIGDVGE